MRDTDAVESGYQRDIVVKSNAALIPVFALQVSDFGLGGVKPRNTQEFAKIFGVDDSAL